MGSARVGFVLTSLRILPPSALAATLLVASPAWAEVRARIPQGWATSRSAPDAVEDMANAAGARVVQRLKTSAIDDFQEGLTVLDVPRPLAPDATRDEVASREALRAWTRRLGGAEAEPAGVEVRGLDDEVSVVVGYVDVGEVRHTMALVPAGTRHGVLVMTTRIAERSLYDSVFDDVVASVSGAEPPLVPFAMGQLRRIAGAAWALVGVLAFLGVGMTADRAGDQRRTGIRAAVVLLGLAVLVTAGATMGLGKHDAALRAAGSDALAAGIELGAYGLVAAVLVFVVGATLGRSRVVQSAPSAGVYATRSTASGATPSPGTKLYDDGGMGIIKVDIPGGRGGASASSSSRRAELSAADMLEQELHGTPPDDEELSAADMLIEELEAKVKGRPPPPRRGE